MTASLTLKSITTETKDGEWGKGQPFESSIQMAVIRGTDFATVRTGGFSHLPIRYIPDRIASRKTLRPYDILIETAGGSKDRPTGRTLLIKPSLIAKSELPLTCASFARFIRIDQSKADPVYVFWLLQHLYEAGFIKQYHTQHTGVARFQFTTFAEREPLHLPAKSVQCQVAAVLSAYDDLIENNTRRIKILEEMAQMIYREWFVNFRFSGHQQVEIVDSEMGSIPKGWRIGQLGDIADIQWGDTSVTKASYVKEAGFKAFSASGPDGWLDYFDFDRVGIALSAIGANCGLTWYTTGKWSCIKNTICLWAIDAKTTTEFLYFATKGKDFWPKRGSAQPFISLGDARSKQLVIPPLAVSIAFSKISADILSLIETLEHESRNLRQTRDLLLPKLISGQVTGEQCEAEAVAQGV
jgi:type I restriction enzyme S subunit